MMFVDRLTFRHQIIEKTSETTKLNLKIAN